MPFDQDTESSESYRYKFNNLLLVFGYFYLDRIQKLNNEKSNHFSCNKGRQEFGSKDSASENSDEIRIERNKEASNSKADDYVE